MPNWIIAALIAIVFAVVAAWVVRRLLDASIGWIRAIVVALIVFVISSPIALWSLGEADVYVDGHFEVDGLIAVAFIALTLGWVFAAVVVAVLTTEFLWPSRGFRNPITAVRDALRRRDRARRYLQILAIGSKHGLGMYESRKSGTTDLPSAVVAAMNDAGVTFVKLGQVLSTRDDVLPAEIIDALATLQMDSTPIPWADVEGVIAAQLGQPVDDVFAEIDPVPLAAASVAQVHVGTLLSGEEVVIKIQRPSARTQVTTDLDILERLAAEAERRTDWAKSYGAAALAAEFSRALKEELDYRVEASNTDMLRAAIAKFPSVLRVPALYAQYSTEQMLVQGRAEGTPFSRLNGTELNAAQGAELADSVLSAVFDQIAVRGVFHADLHPGNLILSEPEADGSRTVSLIDFGAVGLIEKSLRRMLIPLLIAVANEDDVAATDLVLLICESDSSLDKAALQHDLGLILTRMHQSGTNEGLFRLLLGALRGHRLALPTSLLLVFRTLGALEGTLRKLSPGYDMVGRALELVPEVARGAFSPKSSLLSAQVWSAVALEQARRLPRRVESITRALENGDLSVKLATFESASERSWIGGILGRATTTIIGITLVITGIMLSVTADGASDGPMLTGNVPAFAFVGSAMGLGGLLLLLRSLRLSLRKSD